MLILLTTYSNIHFTELSNVHINQDEVVVLSNNEVVVALNTNEHESPFEDEDDFGIEEDRNVQID
jgi:hypothetical protein